MRWLNPARGSKRTRVYFAWFPVRTDDGVTVWLERYTCREMFETYASPEMGGAVEAGPAWLPYEVLAGARR